MTVCSKKGYNTTITEEMTADPFMGDAKCGSRFTLPEGYKELGMIAPSGPIMLFLLYENPRLQLLAAGAFLHRKKHKGEMKMSCKIIVDLLPVSVQCLQDDNGKVRLETVQCRIEGSTPDSTSASLELILFYPRSAQRELIENAVKEGNLLRVDGRLRRYCYQDRNGAEVDKIQLVADGVEASTESSPRRSVVFMEGGVRPFPNSEFVQDNGDYKKAAFWMFTDPKSKDVHETYLTMICTAFGETASQIEKMKLCKNAHLIVTGRLEVLQSGKLGVRLYEAYYGRSKRS